jgi:hypothetical protein
VRGRSPTATLELVSCVAESPHLSVEDNGREPNVLCQGKMAVVACLCKLTRTEYGQHSFSVNLALCTVNLNFQFAGRAQWYGAGLRSG